MTDAISAINTSASSMQQTSASKLSDATKKKLEALGVDTSSITSETQGLQKLKEAQAAQGNQQAQGVAQQQSQQPQANNSMESIETEAKSLASKVGVSVGSNDKIDDIMEKISSQISSMKTEAGTDEVKKLQASNYQATYDTIQNRLNQAQAMTTSMDAMASYNKAALGL